MILWLPLLQLSMTKEYLVRFYIGFLVQGFPRVMRRRIQFQMQALHSLGYLMPHNLSYLHYYLKTSVSMPHPLGSSKNFAQPFLTVWFMQET